MNLKKITKILEFINKAKLLSLPNITIHCDMSGSLKNALGMIHFSFIDNNDLKFKLRIILKEAKSKLRKNKTKFNALKMKELLRYLKNKR